MTKKERKKYLGRDDISIEGNVATWRIAAHGNINGSYFGTFKFKCFLTPSEKLAAGRYYRELLGPNAQLAFKSEDDIAYVLSQLKYRILSAPPFWTSAIGVDDMQGDIADESVIGLIFDAATTAELKYRALLEEKREVEIAKAKKAAEELLQQKGRTQEQAEEELNENESES